MSSDPLNSHDRCFCDVLAQRADVHPDRTAYICVGADGEETSRLSYGDLHQRVEHYAAALTALGVGGSRALMLFEPGAAFVIAFLGCLRAGVVAIPANVAKPGRTSWDRLIAIVRDSGASCILTEQESTPKFAGWFATSPDLSALKILCLEDRSDDLPVVFSRPHRDTPAFLQYTSGSTGDPKGTVVTFGNLAANASLTGPAFGIHFDARVVTWLPPYHDLGLIGNILQVLWDGAFCVLMPPVSFVQNPARWLETIERYRATVSMAPNFAYELCVRRIPQERRARLDLSSWEVAINAAEPIRASAIHRFTEAFRGSGFRPHALRSAYGLAEATLVVSAGGAGLPPALLEVDSPSLDMGKLVLRSDARTSREIVSSGYVRSPQRVCIVNPETLAVCESNEIGEIWVGGPCVAKGYWARKEETKRTFGAMTASGEGPFLRTGDLGILVEGQLYVTGRIKEVIIVRGRKIYPQDIEATVQRAHDALKPAGGAAFALESQDGESLVVVQEIERSALSSINRDMLVSLISDAVFKAHDLAVSDVVLVKPEVVPKTSSGKIQRVLCRELYSRGELDLIVQGRSSRGNSAKETADAASRVANKAQPVASITSESVIALVNAWLVVSGRKAPTDPRQTFAELGVDSMGAIELADFLQTRLQVEVDQTIVYGYPTLDALAQFIESIGKSSNSESEKASEIGAPGNSEVSSW